MYSQNNHLNLKLKVWMLSLLLLITLIILVGGLTRLTDSGLSITTWELFVGTLPPLSHEKWIDYFNLYKTIPEYNEQNFNMTLSEFKVIFWWEWAHRQLGRLIGLLVLLPMIYFTIKNGLWILKEYLIIFLLVCFQGFIGWYMVSSGLTERVDVSHFRLSVHLFIAFIILASLTWYYFNFRAQLSKNFFYNDLKFGSIKLFIFLVFLQIIFGALVSGLDAGRIYQTWPLMNNAYFPSDVNFNNYKEFLNLNDSSVVQFLHRNIAYLIFFVLIIMGFNIKNQNKKNLYKPYIFLVFFVSIQIILGVLTLITNLNIATASLHQISSIFLIFFTLNFYYKSIN